MWKENKKCGWIDKIILYFQTTTKSERETCFSKPSENSCYFFNSFFFMAKQDLSSNTKTKFNLFWNPRTQIFLVELILKFRRTSHLKPELY